MVDLEENSVIVQHGSFLLLKKVINLVNLSIQPLSDVIVQLS